MDEEELARNPEIQRLILLWEEGLLCKCCHGELSGREETERGICLECIAYQALLQPEPDNSELPF